MSEPGKPAEQADTPDAGRQDPHTLIQEVTSALQQGRAPRAGRYLQAAARELADREDKEGAARALHAVALLELRRGKPQQALRPARAAERLVRESTHSGALPAILDLLSRLYSYLGEHAQAVRFAAQAHDHARDPACRATRRRLALAHWAGGDVSAALQVVEAPESEASADAILLAQMLTRVGCPTAAQASLTRMLKEDLPAAEECEALAARGWAVLCLGHPDQALRGFRRAVRLGAELDVPRKQLELELALTAGELEREKARGTDLGRIQSRLERKRAQASRVGLHHLADPLELAHSAPATALGATTAKEAAQRLVAMARTSECLALVDACCLEVERLRLLPPGDAPYDFSRMPPLSLE